MGLFDFLRKLFNPSAPQRPLAAAPPNSSPAPSTALPALVPPSSTPTNPPAVPVSPWADPVVTPPRDMPPPGRPQFRNVKLELDAEQFRPLATDQVKQQAAGQLFGGFWQFGRRDRIPSALDPRTKLIDQAMVRQGLITPDDLVKIHQIGEQMELLRPELPGSHVLAQQAVAADKRAREQIKARKKAAAEQRKRDHAERVANNKRTDIIHLGRGVSRGLADRRGDAEKLARQQLPVLSTPAELAEAMGMPVPRLRWLAYHAEASTVCHYVHFVVPKKSGGERTLSAPHKHLAGAQQWILEQILAKLPAHDAAHGFVQGRSILTNATPHVAAAVIVNCDLTDFFPSITVHRVMGFFRHVGYSPAVATILALLSTESPRRKVLYHGKPWHVATGPRRPAAGSLHKPGAIQLDCPAARLAAERAVPEAELDVHAIRRRSQLFQPIVQRSDRVSVGKSSAYCPGRGIHGQ